MPRTTSVTEAKAKLSSLMEWAVRHQDAVIIESRGNPKAVIIPYEGYEQFKKLQEQARHQEALNQMEQLAAKIQARSQDLDEKRAAAIADQFTREVIEEIRSEGS